MSTRLKINEQEDYTSYSKRIYTFVDDGTEDTDITCIDQDIFIPYVGKVAKLSYNTAVWSEYSSSTTSLGKALPKTTGFPAENTTQRLIYIDITLPTKSAGDVWIKINGSYVNSDAIYIKVNGAYIEPDKVYLKENGSYIEV